MKILAAIPPFASAINIGGGEEDCVRIKLDMYLTPSQIQELMSLRGQQLTLDIKRSSEE